MSAARRKTSRKSTQHHSRWLGRAFWLAACVTGLIVAASSSLWAWSRLPGPGGGESKVLTLQSDPVASIGEQLERAGLVRQPWLFDVYLRVSGRFSSWQAGKHFLRGNMTPKGLADCLVQAPNRPSVMVAIPEGFDIYRLSRRLESLGVCQSTDFLSLAHSQPLLSELGLKGPSVEGYLFPLTYSWPLDSDPRAIIIDGVAETRRRLARLAEEHAANYHQLTIERGWGEHEILTLASMVEKETPHPDERPIIAGVFFNRLDSAEFLPRQMLQSDPTAHYGCLVSPDLVPSCRASNNKPTPAMLRDSANTYNTYRHPGLPPGPIANPGEGSIAAVLEPTHSEFFFFVAKNGRHVFSRTLAEHASAIRDAE